MTACLLAGPRPLPASPVYHFRPFRNSDPPRLAEIWRSQPPQRGILQPVSAPMLEFAVFSKAHFDRNGLIVAERDGVPVGFAHAGFGPNEDGTGLDKSIGTTHMLMMKAGDQPPSSACEDMPKEVSAWNTRSWVGSPEQRNTSISAPSRSIGSVGGRC